MVKAKGRAGEELLTPQNQEVQTEENAINGLRDIQCHTNLTWVTLISTGIYLVKNQLTEEGNFVSYLFERTEDT